MTTQDHELSAALGWPGGISDPVLDRTQLLQMVAALMRDKLWEDHRVKHLWDHTQEQAEPDHETRAELAEQQVVQLAEERDHYRNLWQKAQQAEPVDSGYWGRVAARQASRIKQLETTAQQALEALKGMLHRDERNTCRHEETHRGGAIWEICDSCGAMWADDEGGKPEWEDPKEWTQARAAIALVEGRVKAVEGEKT